MVAGQADQELGQAFGPHLPSHLRLGQRPVHPFALRPQPVARRIKPAGVIIHAKPVDRLGDPVHVIVPALGQVRFQSVKRGLRIALAHDRPDEPLVIDGILDRCRADRAGTVVGGMRGFEIQHDTQVFRAACAQGMHGCSMGQQHMVHGAGGGADVAQARGVLAQEMRQPGDAPGFVQRGGAGQAVAQPRVNRGAVIGKASGDVPVLPAAHIRQRGGQIPVIAGQVRGQPAFHHPIDQPVIEIHGLRIDRHPVGHDPRPGGRKAIG